MSAIQMTPAIQNALAVVVQKRIYFAHQSVGANIVEGIDELCRDSPELRLDVRETTDAAVFDRPVFAHAKVGENGRRHTKLADFANKIDAGIGERADAAIFKFCYIDITARTDVERLFRLYEETMTWIRRRHENLVIVHVTVPLTTVQKGIKARIKAVTGLAKSYQDNVRRNQYNDFLLMRYQGSEPVFDLASIEATAPNGEVETFSMAGRRWLALFPPFSDDGGHLAAPGRAKAAEGLLVTLAALP